MANIKNRYLTLVLLSASAYIISFFSQIVMAYHFGTSQVMDVYWGALALVGLLGFYIPPLKEALVPALHRAKAKGGDEHVERLFSAGLTMLFAITSLACFILFVFGAGFSKVLTDVGESVNGAIVAIVPWLIIYLFLFGLAETLNSILISFNNVMRQALARISAALMLLVSLAVIGSSLGVKGLLLAQIVSLSALAFVSWLTLQSLKPNLMLNFWPELYKSGMLSLFMSLMLTYLAAQLYVVAERAAMIQMGTGLLSGFQYSVALVNAFVSLLAYPLSNLLWSKFLSQAAEGDSKAAHLLATRACGLLIYSLVVLCGFVWVNAREIIVLIYSRGAFDEASIQLTTTALRSTIFAAIPIGVSSVLGRWLISLPGAHRQLWIGLTTIVVGSLVIGMALLADSPRGIMLHWLIANLAAMLVSGAIFASEVKFSLDQKLAAGRWLGQVAVVAILAAWITPPMVWGESKFSLAAALLAQGGLYLLVVAGLTWFFGMIPSLQRLLWAEV